MATPAPFWDQVAQANVPEFEKPMAAQMPVVYGSEHPDAISYVNVGDPHIYVTPSRAAQFTPGAYAHELEHGIQQKAGEKRPTDDAAGQADYNYGGIAGLDRLNQSGKTVGSLNPEQRANIPEDYVAQMAAWRAKAKAGKLTPQDLKNADEMNRVYAWPIHQEAIQASDTIDTTPQPPGPPPAALTGQIVPLPDVGGHTIFATHEKTGHRIMTKDGGKSWQPAQ